MSFIAALESEEKSVSAINLKTGSSVISLELGPRPSKDPTKSPKILPKGKQKKRSSVSIKDKKGRKQSCTKSDEALPDALTALALNTYGDFDDSDQVLFIK